MGRRAGGGKKVQAGRKNRGMETQAGAIVFDTENPERSSGVRRAHDAAGDGLCAGKRDGRGVPVRRDGEKLGFIVTWVGTQYPDVEAFREVAPGRWQRV